MLWTQNGDEHVLEITTDIGGSEVYRGSLCDYTMEVKATPTEIGDAAGWSARRRALDALVVSMNSAGTYGGKLQAGDAGPGFQVVVRNARHWFHLESDHLIAGSSDQATVGLPAEDIGKATLLHDHARWFSAAHGADLDTAGPWVDVALAKALYSLVISAITQLALLIESDKLAIEGMPKDQYTTNPYDSSIKNKWGVLPRTPPYAALDVLSDGDKREVKRLIREHPVPQGVTARAWAAARGHITARSDLAGHQVPAPTIDGKPGALFEFRTSAEAFAEVNALWTPDYARQRTRDRPRDQHDVEPMPQWVLNIREKLPDLEDQDVSDDEWDD